MPMRIGTPMPPLAGATEWLKGSAEEVLQDAAGQPVLVHFWSLSCGMCKENLPKVAEWRDRYRAAGLRVVAVHMPRYPADMDVDAARAIVSEHGIIEPVAVDNQHQLRDAFLNDKGYVPAYYLFDAEHKLKSFAAGEYGVKVMEPALERMFAAVQTASSASLQ